MIAIVIMLILTALMLLIAGIGVATLVGVMVAIIGSLAVAGSLKDVESKYTSWSYWTKVALKFVAVLLLVCGCSYQSLYTVVAGLGFAIILMIFCIIMGFIENRKSKSTEAVAEEAVEEAVEG